MADNVAGGGRAQVRRTLARGARRLQHGRPTLSVVVQVVGGDPGYLHETIASVRNQASPKIEILIVGDEAGLTVARALAGDDTRVRFLAASSVHEARALGLRRSRGTHVILASAGDAYPDGVLVELIEGMEADKAFVLTSGFSPRLLTDLDQTPYGASNPYLGRFLVPRSRALGAGGAGTDQDPNGYLTGLRLLRTPFRDSGWTSYRNARTATRGPFVARPNPFSELPAQIDRDLATLAALEGLPADRSARAQGALSGLRRFLDSAEIASEDQWAALSKHAGLMCEAADGDLEGVPVVDRVLALLAAAGHRDDVVALAGAVEDDFATAESEDRVFAVLPVAEGLLPQDAFEVTDSETLLRARVNRLVVEEAPGQASVRVELFVGASRLAQGLTDTVRVQLHHDDTVREMRVRIERDPAVTRWMAETEHDHDAGLVHAEIEVADLPEGMHLIWVLWSDGIRERGTFPELSTNGSASRAPVAVSADRSIGLHLRHGRVALGITGARAPSTGLVTRVEADDEYLRLTLDPKIDTVSLEGHGRHIAGEPGTPGFWKIPLADDPWGLGSSPLPTGAYRLVLSAGSRKVPATAGSVVMDRLPDELRTGRHRILLQRGDIDTVALRLDPLLTDDELGPRAQRRLQREYTAITEPLDPSLVYFQSFTGQWANDNPLAIQTELVRRRSDLDVRWVVADSSSSVPDGARPLLFRSREWYDVMSRASYLVTNIELEKWYARRPGQQVLQTFHGYPSKAMGLGLWKPRGLTPSQIEGQLDHTSRVWNNLVTPAPEMDQYYRRDYAYKGRILALGYPRNDVLLGPAAAELRAQTRDRLGIATGQQAVLYAPTWRDDLATNFRSAQAVHHLDVEQAAAALGEDYVLLMRGHRFHAPSRGSGSRVIDVTSHPDINHLIAAADVAVLDYSSLRFDFAITGKPMVFLVPDLETYGSRTRGFLWDYRETAPGPLVATTTEVVAELRDVDRLTTRWSADLVAFNARYNALHDGRAAERVVSEFFADLL